MVVFHERCCQHCVGTPRVDPFMSLWSSTDSNQKKLRREIAGPGRPSGLAARPGQERGCVRRGASRSAPATARRGNGSGAAGVLPGDHAGTQRSQSRGSAAVPQSLLCCVQVHTASVTAEQLYGSSRKQAMGYPGLLWHLRNTP